MSVSVFASGEPAKRRHELLLEWLARLRIDLVPVLPELAEIRKHVVRRRAVRGLPLVRDAEVHLDGADMGSDAQPARDRIAAVPRSQ